MPIQLDHPLAQLMRSHLARIASFVIDARPDASVLLESGLGRWCGSYRADTLRGIAADLGKWLDWLEERMETGSPFESSALAAYVKHLESESTSPISCHHRALVVVKVMRALGVFGSEARRFFRELAVASTAARRTSWKNGPKREPAGWEQLQQCIAVANPNSYVDARTIAIALTLYDTLAKPFQLLGHFSGNTWHTSPVRFDQFRELADGTGEIGLNPGVFGPASTCFLSALTVQWIQRHRESIARSDQAALFQTARGNPCTHHVWLQTQKSLVRLALGDGAVLRPSELRLGAAKDMLRAGLPLEAVRQAGRWRSVMPLIRLFNTPYEGNAARDLAVLQGRMAADHALAPAGRKGALPSTLGTTYFRRSPAPVDEPKTMDLFPG